MKSPEDLLLILSPGFAANEADTSCLPAQQQLVRGINKNFPGKKIIIVALQYPFVQEPYEWFGNTVVPIGGRNRKHFYRLWVWMRAWKKITNLNKKYSINGVLCFWYGECAFIGKQFAKKYGLKYFAWLLGQDARPGNKYVNLTAAKPDELIAISEFTAGQFMQNYGTRPTNVVTNAVTPDLFPQPPASRDIDVLAVGSLIPLKQHTIFIDVVEQLTKIYPSIKGTICGSGSEQQKLEKLIKEKGLSGNITLTGSLSYTDTLSTMQRSRILLHTSNYEGYSGVCLEALYAGAQVISFCNPKEDWVRQWHIVKDAKDMEKIALEILSDRNIIYRPVLLHDMDDVAKRLITLFE